MTTSNRASNLLAPALRGAIFLGASACLSLAALSIPAQAQRAATSPSNIRVEWIQFQDPFEKAFTVDVPKGWTVKGGLFRLGYSDERPMVDFLSPDGTINIRLGDVSIPTYTNPNQFHREGEIYDLGAQAHMVVERYRSGPEFGVMYAQARFAKTCHDPQSDPQASDFSLKEDLPQDPTTPTQVSGGQTAFHCVTDHGPRIAYAYTRTALYGQIWQATAVVSFSAPPEDVASVREIVARAVPSFHLNPDWLEYQKRMDAEGLDYQRVRQQGRMRELQAQVQQFEAKMQAMQNQVNAFERRQNAQAAQVESFSSALNGITPTTDPLTGENRQVWTGPKSNYWVNGLGQVVNSTNAPAAGWRQLQTN